VSVYSCYHVVPLSKDSEEKCNYMFIVTVLLGSGFVSYSAL